MHTEHKWRTAVGLLVVVCTLTAASYRAMRSHRSEPVSVAAQQSERHIITPHARTPRLKSLDPKQFKDPETRAAYQVAKDNPELLEKMPCYCGCFEIGHTSNYDCFVDNHGTGCAMCRRIALDAQKMHKNGIPVDAIKKEIDEKWAR